MRPSHRGRSFTPRDSSVRTAVSKTNARPLAVGCSHEMSSMQSRFFPSWLERTTVDRESEIKRHCPAVQHCLVNGRPFRARNRTADARPLRFAVPSALVLVGTALALRNAVGG